MHILSWEREDILERMRNVVDGELDLLANVSQITDWETVMKASITLSVASTLNTDDASALQTRPGASVQGLYRA